jgi:hypothetical protein
MSQNGVRRIESVLLEVSDTSSDTFGSTFGDVGEGVIKYRTYRIDYDLDDNDLRVDPLKGHPQREYRRKIDLK